MNSRYTNIDGLRTIAIFWVAIYHYCYFWAPDGPGDVLLPYGDALYWVPLAEYGEAGVSLFFVISAFLIRLSLERASSFWTFSIKRLIRLWPTLLVCGTATFSLTSLLGPELLQRSVAEYAISLTFLPPSYLNALPGIAGMEWLDGAYWSLWVEVRFYAIVGLLFFLFPQRFERVWFVFFVMVSAVAILPNSMAHVVDRVFFADHLPFFSIGIALAGLVRGGGRMMPLSLLAVAITVLSLRGFLSPEGLAADVAASYLLVLALACYGLLNTRRSAILSSRAFVLVGRSSYAYYLLHQNAGLALTGSFAEWMHPIAAMVLAQAAVLAFCIGFTLLLEEPWRKALMRLLLGRPEHAAVPASGQRA